MAKDVLIYGSIDDYYVEDYFEAINEAVELNEEVQIRINTPGGDVETGWGMVAKFLELNIPKSVKVDGKAYSMGLMFLCYTDNVSALDVSQFLLHRAAYSEWIESEPRLFTDDRKKHLAEINKKLRTAFENKVDVAVFEQITGHTLDEVFSMDSRLDIFFNAKEAKKMGLINEIVTITPAKKAEINAKMFAIAAKHTGKNKPEPIIAPNSTNSNLNNKPKDTIMTIEEFKAQHPALYAQAVQNGVNQERDRVGAFLAFATFDAEKAIAGAKGTETLSATAMAEFTVIAAQKAALGTIAQESPQAVATNVPPTPPTANNTDKTVSAQEVEFAKFVEETNAKLGIVKPAQTV